MGAATRVQEDTLATPGFSKEKKIEWYYIINIRIRNQQILCTMHPSDKIPGSAYANRYKIKHISFTVTRIY